MLFLASQSPRRKAILKFIGIPFQAVKSTGVREIRKPNESPSHMVCRLALEKAQEVSRRFPQHWVLGADTVVVQGNYLFGKPKNRQEAARMLMKLQGKNHEVLTGVTLVGPSGAKQARFSHVEKTKVVFRTFSLGDIGPYLKSKEPYDKAGAYDISGTARQWVESWEGDYFNVMGLPVGWVFHQINRFITPGGLNHSKRS